MSKPLSHQVIALARSYIVDDRHWAQCSQALFKNGRVAEPQDPRAWRFCASGAMVRAGFVLTGDIQKARELCMLACEALQPEYVDAVSKVENINDSQRGHERILALFDDYLAAE